MNQELNAKLNILIKSIEDSLNDIRKNGRKARELKKTIQNSRDIVTQVLEQQLGGVSLEDQINISDIPDDDWIITAKHIIDYIDDPFVPVNEYENYFLQLINYLVTTDKNKLVENMMFSFNKIKDEHEEVHEMLVSLLAGYNLPVVSTEESPSVFEMRAEALKQHSYDLLWLYRHTGDYLSKRTLAAVLMNWADFQFTALDVVKSIFKKYWEPDIFSDNKDDIVADIGAGTGDELKEFIEVYGARYKHIYAYEPSPRTFDDLAENIREWQIQNIDIFNKEAGAIKAKKVIQNSSESDGMMIRMSNPEKDEEKIVDIIRIDDDIKEPISFIKISAGVDTQSALIGCLKTIKKNHPKIAICVDSGFEDIWKIPSIVYTVFPGYSFYLRHYGEDLVPKDFVLFCNPPKA